jgi:carboxymethylenebutenolidase
MPVTIIEATAPASRSSALILCHHREGVDEFTIDAGHRLAASGYVVAVPNMYHRRPASEAWELSRKSVSDPDLIADLRATAALLKSLNAVNPHSIGIVGHCMGGRTAFLGATALPNLKAAVILYGGGIFKTEGVGTAAPITMVANINAPLLCLYGDKDHAIPMDETRKLIGVLTEHNVDHEFHLYEGAGHAFQDFSRPKLYVKAASEDAWIRTFSFLRKTMA